MSKHHEAIKNDARWKAARTACLERDGYACVGNGPRCLGTEQLEADHILPLSEYPELAFEVDNLRTLCRPCHQDRDTVATSVIERHEWVSPRYPELADFIMARSLDNSEYPDPVF